MLRLRIDDRAEQDLKAIKKWYDEQRRGLGKEVVRAIRDAINIARLNPDICRRHEGTTRSILSKRFPYRIYFERSADELIVSAVYHNSRDPDHWNDPDRQ